MYTDDLEDSIADALENDWADRDFLSSETISLKVVPGVDLAKNRKLSNQIANIMVNRFGWRKGRKKIDGKTQRGYIKRWHIEIVSPNVSPRWTLQPQGIDK